ncbi:MAG TPA: DUF4282 domain-containing protein [Streptosporangiaceae bacterium]|jgi:hypothetical protein
MTRPSDPGQSPRSPGAGAPGVPGQGGRPYGPPPPLGGAPGRPQGGAPGQPPPQRPPAPPGTWDYEDDSATAVPPSKGFLGSLLDVNFNYLVTPKLIKLFFVLSLMLISLQCLVFLALGLWIASWDNGWAWGVFLIIATPVVWLFEVVLVRILMEAIIVRFKGVEYLRIMKDGPR